MEEGTTLTPNFHKDTPKDHDIAGSICRTFFDDHRAEKARERERESSSLFTHVFIYVLFHLYVYTPRT